MNLLFYQKFREVTDEPAHVFFVRNCMKVPNEFIPFFVEKFVKSKLQTNLFLLVRKIREMYSTILADQARGW